VAFDECGHGPMFEKPDEFYAELVVFLEELVAALPPAAPEPSPAGTA
jgi:pimeloyl-ACP methyl ester carboxylesterase